MKPKHKKKRDIDSDRPAPEPSETSDALGSDKDADSSGYAASAVDTSDDQPDDLAKLRQRVADLEDELLRAKAEQHNIRKRAANERIEAVRFASAAFIKNLLTTVDDFERTFEQGETSDAKTVLEGVRLIYDNLMKVLADARVEIIDAVDKSFDPRYHEALQQATAEGKVPGTVLNVLQRGFKFDDRVIRPAKVVIVAADSAGDCLGENAHPASKSETP